MAVLPVDGKPDVAITDFPARNGGDLPPEELCHRVDYGVIL
jgi:hypothetical protein